LTLAARQDFSNLVVDGRIRGIDIQRLLIIQERLGVIFEDEVLLSFREIKFSLPLADAVARLIRLNLLFFLSIRSRMEETQRHAHQEKTEDPECHQCFLRVTVYDLIESPASRIQGQTTKLSKNPHNL